MNSSKTEAYKLRLQGYSYNEIQKKLGVSKSTQSGWFKYLVLSESARRRLQGRIDQGGSVGMRTLLKRNKLQTKNAWDRARKIQNKAYTQIGRLTGRELLLVGIGLYWAEGYKKLIIRDGIKRTGHIISLTNADPYLARFFVLFLTRSMGIPREKIKITMRLYKHINESHAKMYWKKATSLRDNNFTKSTFQVSRSSKGIRPYNRLPYGTIQIAVYNTEEFHRILGWIEALKQVV